MIKSLLRRKTFYRARLFGKDWRIILDGTGLFYFKERHCQNCLTKVLAKEDGKQVKTYYHHVLEAKTAAAYRLLERLSKEYPRLPVCIQGDSLYETEPIMQLCREKKWDYIFTHKGGRQKIVNECYEWICKGSGSVLVEKIGKERGTGGICESCGRNGRKKRNHESFLKLDKKWKVIHNKKKTK